MLRKKLAPLERSIEFIIFTSRWLLVPFYLGLAVALVIMVVKFVDLLIGNIPHIAEMDQTHVILMAVAMIDMSLTGNLLVMVIFAGYENFISKIDLHEEAERPDWMGTISFSDLKLKLMASIVAISAIHLLEAFMAIEKYSNEKLGWLVGIHMTFVVSALLLAWVDKFSHSESHPGGHH